MKRVFIALVLTIITSSLISSCTEESIKPQDGGSGDPCQFGGAGCK